MTFEECILRWKSDLKLRQLRRRCYEAIDKIRDGNTQLCEVNREIKVLLEEKNHL